MYLRIQNLLDEKQLEALDKLLGKAKFIEGSKAAAPAVRRVTNNLQVDREKTDKIEDIDEIILGALRSNQSIQSAVLPLKITPPAINRHEPGMLTGPHADPPIAGTNPPVRSDLAVAVFLSDPDSYEGGELTIKTEAGDASFKMPRGHALVYPAGAIHAIRKVTSGVRLAATSWIQSAVRDHAKRQMLLELDMANGTVNKKSPDSDEAKLLAKIHGNLLRMWGDI